MHTINHIKAALYNLNSWVTARQFCSNHSYIYFFGLLNSNGNPYIHMGIIKTQ